MTTKRTPQTDRTRPRWAMCIHHLGDDLSWALSAWCHFPRPARRITAIVTTSVGGWIVGADDAIASIAHVLIE